MRTNHAMGSGYLVWCGQQSNKTGHINSRVLSRKKVISFIFGSFPLKNWKSTRNPNQDLPGIRNVVFTPGSERQIYIRAKVTLRIIHNWLCVMKRNLLFTCCAWKWSKIWIYSLDLQICIWRTSRVEKHALLDPGAWRQLNFWQHVQASSRKSSPMWNKKCKSRADPIQPFDDFHQNLPEEKFRTVHWLLSDAALSGTSLVIFSRLQVEDVWRVLHSTNQAMRHSEKEEEK